MSDVQVYWRMDRPATSLYTSALTDQPSRPIRTYLPQGYVPGYAYPLLVLFPAAGQTTEQALKFAPKISDQNFVMMSVQQPDGTPEATDLTDTVWDAVRQTRRMYHIHSERVYLVGLNEGCAAAYQVAFSLGDKVAGVVALNGQLPEREAGKPLFNWHMLRQQKVLIARTPSNTAAVQAARLLDTAGANVSLRLYNTEDPLHPLMLADVNRWVMQHVLNAPSRTPAQKSR